MGHILFIYRGTLHYGTDEGGSFYELEDRQPVIDRLALLTS